MLAKEVQIFTEFTLTKGFHCNQYGDKTAHIGIDARCVMWPCSYPLDILKSEVFTLLHEFLRIPPDSQWKVGISWNSMEFLWKAFGWSLSHLGFLFHGNSHFFPRNSNGNGWNLGSSGNDSQWNPWDSIGILLKFCWNSMGKSLIVIVKNSTIVKNRTLMSATHHMSERKSVLAVALYDY